MQALFRYKIGISYCDWRLRRFVEEGYRILGDDAVQTGNLSPTYRRCLLPPFFDHGNLPHKLIMQALRNVGSNQQSVVPQKTPIDTKLTIARQIKSKCIRQFR